MVNCDINCAAQRS